MTTLFFALAIATSSIGIAAQGLTSQPLQIEIFDETAEYRLKSLRRQDRSVNVFTNALETDKAYFTFSEEDESTIYSPALNIN